MSSNEKELNILPSDQVTIIDFEHVEMVTHLFFEESNQILSEIDNLILRFEENPSDTELLNALFRKIHTIKGSVGSVPGGQLMGSVAHEFEALLLNIKHGLQTATKDCINLFLKSSRILKVLAVALNEKRELYPEELSEAIELIASYSVFRSLTANNSNAVQNRFSSNNSAPEEGFWISKKQFEQFISISGELLVLKNFFHMIQQTVNFRTQPEVFERRQNDFSQNLSKICDQFQNQVQTVQLEKVSELFQELTVLARQTSAELNKNVQLEIIGGDLLIDKSLGKDLYEALVHIIRNSIDHGIEDQFERTLQGKPAAGTLVLEIFEKNNKINIVYKDDGKGLDSSKILEKVINSGAISSEQASKLTTDEIHKFIFNTGISTKDKVTTLSGRGVGMNVVQDVIEKYSGIISIENQPGLGVCFRMEVPVPKQVMVESTLLCSWNGYKFAVPLTSVVHISSCSELKFTTVDHLRYCQFNGFTVSLLNYHEMVNLKTSADNRTVKKSSAVFIKAEDTMLSLMVDSIEGQADLVIKSFGNVIRNQKAFKGVSVLADENIAYVLDPEKMAKLLFKSSMSLEEAV
ncbi:MAG: chemotaxis protein CheA [Bdellovibrio sp.]